MNFLDLFSGIGGFALGAEWAGMQFDAHYYSEVDPYAIKVYEKRFPDAFALGDITKIDGTKLPASDWIIAGGFPCQDISVAGKGAGLEGERSGLWFEYARLIGELRPRYAIMENVGALTFRGLDSVLGSLAEIGYDAEWQDIRASDVGAPHRRERIWIVAYRQDERATRGERIAGYGSINGEVWNGRGIGGRGDARREALADATSDGREPRRAECTGLEGQPGAIGGGAYVADADGDRPYCPQGYAPKQGSDRANHGLPLRGSSWWSVEPDVGRVAHGVPARVDRLKCLGNSIVPQIAEMIFRQIKQL